MGKPKHQKESAVAGHLPARNYYKRFDSRIIILHPGETKYYYMLFTILQGKNIFSCLLCITGLR